MLITYLPADSFLYRLNPIIKGLIIFLLIIAFSVAFSGVVKLSALLLLLLVVARLGKAPLIPILGSLSKIAVLLVIVALIQGFSRGGFSYILALEAVLRIVGVFFSAGIFVTISSQSELMYFWEQSFRPFQLVGIPARELALVMVIAVRFLPVILSEIDRIRMAQIARGANMGAKAGLFAVKSLLPLLIPTLSLAIMRANDLAIAMEARGYSVSKSRSRFRSYRPGFLDIFALLMVLSSLIILFFAGFSL
jgi:energy-coupling factor transport system permease protein